MLPHATTYRLSTYPGEARQGFNLCSFLSFGGHWRPYQIKGEWELESRNAVAPNHIYTAGIQCDSFHESFNLLRKQNTTE